MLMLDLWLQAETPGVTHFGAYHRPPDGHFLVWLSALLMAFCRYWSCMIGIVPFFYSFYFAFCPISFTYLEGAISSFWKMFVNCSYSYWPPHFSFSEVCCTETKGFKGGLKAFPAEYQAKPENIGANKPSQKNIWYNKPRQAKPDQTKGNFYGVKVDKYKILEV